jgi:cell fate regulator YaaT (PSP1 superfamily)
MNVTPRSNATTTAVTVETTVVEQQAPTKVAGCSSGKCGTGGCNQKNAFDWLSHMGITASDTDFNIVEVKFKGGRKEFCHKKTPQLHLITGDPVVIEMPGGGLHLGYVSLQGELVRLQMKKYKVNASDELPTILKVANENDIEKYEQARNREIPTLFRSRQIINELKLDMKLTDVEYYSDNTKATFFYTAEGRIDFRELIKQLANEFKVRIEMRQISLRQEAGRIGGIGSCGRELCCSTWLSDFKSVSTTAARYQNLSLNPAKLSGQCGRLKCCLNYELETYLQATKDIPQVEKAILTEKGEAYLQKTDIFRKILWFSYKNETTWHALTAERVAYLLQLNATGKKALALTEAEEKAFALAEESKPNQELLDLDKKLSRMREDKRKEGQNKSQQKEPEKRGNIPINPELVTSSSGKEEHPQQRNPSPPPTPDNRFTNRQGGKVLPKRESESNKLQQQAPPQTPRTERQQPSVVNQPQQQSPRNAQVKPRQSEQQIAPTTPPPPSPKHEPQKPQNSRIRKRDNPTKR